MRDLIRDSMRSAGSEVLEASIVSPGDESLRHQVDMMEAHGLRKKRAVSIAFQYSYASDPF